MLKQFNYVMDKRQKRNLVLIFVMIIIGSGLELLSVAGISPIVAVITDENIINTQSIYILIGEIFHFTTSRQYVLFLSLVLIGAYVIKNVYVVFENQMQYQYTYSNQRRLVMELLTYYLNREYLFHVNTNVADLQRNVETDVIKFWDVVLAMMQLAMEMLVCIILMAYLFVVDWKSTTALVVLLGGFLGIFMLFYKKYSVRLGAKCREYRSLMTKSILQAFAGIKEVKVMNKESFFSNVYDRAFEKYCVAQRKQSVATILPKPIMESVCICGLLLIMSVRIYQGSDMKEMVPVLSAFVVAAYRMLPSFNRITSYYGNIMYGKASVVNVYQDVKNKRESEPVQKSTEQDTYEFEIASDISIRNLSFAYPGNEKNVLNRVSLTIPLNHSVAFIGASGAGKSTLADLVLGVLTPQEGEVVVDDTNIYDHLEAWHRKVGYIPQVIYLLDDSIRNNVAFGIEAEKIDDALIWRALHEAQLDEFVKNLPEGLDTEVGDRGVRLSGGQRQRIGIARALYSDPKILILDEATSALDNDTETAVMEAIDRLQGSKTMIIIAHRLSTIQNCDLVYEVGNGEVTLKR